MQSVVGLIATLVVAVLLALSGLAALRLTSRILRWGGAGLAFALTIAVSAVGALTATGLVRQHTRSAPLPDLKVAATAERVARGKAVADSFCSGCHTTTGPLTGGGDLAKDIPIDIGSFVAANLTPAGALQHWSDAEIFRAIRNGVDADGRWLVIMSFTNASRLSDEDTFAVIAYLRSLAAAGAPTPGPLDRFNWLGTTMLGAGLLPDAKPVTTAEIVAPPTGPTAQYGEYLLSYQDCRECHGQNLAGGVPGQLPPLGPDLAVVKDWSLAQFIATMRTGIDPNGHQLGAQMPWRPIGRMGDDELAAM
ncbi:Nicotinate dehydrogenase subunit B [Bradyrhizobium ivorense]|uniref:Nicotinate dehydrogenase subunit B n=1 Tax=Bradyrhizobium ivorense TaxID=2511166 RepID=A0A508TY82_9BRAD|nr:c-type cytochrome [Bradyrhizobium ivorense]VIO79324.1 Nicotinate dehydrogenase subunit B [Bradyrhizobium ivorense]